MSILFFEMVKNEKAEAGVRLALHPDEPPTSPLCGVGRIFTSAAAFRRTLGLNPSPAHGLAFCQATFAAMGEDLSALIAEFGSTGKFFFVHIRDIEGTKLCFRENGPSNMPALLRTYLRAGFNSLVRPHHVPSMAGENQHNPARR
jgi:mannonate dehydratase